MFDNKLDSMIGHIRENKKSIETKQIKKEDIQILHVHLKNVRDKTGMFASKLGLTYCGRIIGFLHDIGKGTQAFKAYILAEAKGEKGVKAPHSIYGGLILFRRYYKETASKENDGQKLWDNVAVEILCNAILAHHTGLYAYITTEETDFLFRRLTDPGEGKFYEEVITYFLSISSWEALDDLFHRASGEIKKMFPKNVPFFKMSLGFISKYLYSCLIDADRLDAFLFEENQKEIEEKNHKTLWPCYYEQLVKHIQSLDHGEPLDAYRRDISESSAKKAEGAVDIYSFTTPTGGGKTFSAFRFCLRHAMFQEKEKIFYITNYLNVLEQNAEAIKEAISSAQEKILEFHSNVIQEEIKEKKEGKIKDDEGDYSWERKRIRSLEERWDAPIIFTSVVQFLNTFFDKKSANRRRLHQLANSVIIFDEVQSMPIHCVHLFFQSIQFLKTMNTTSILCTATQPHYGYLREEKPDFPQEILDGAADYFEKFRRVHIHFREEIIRDKIEARTFLEEILDENNSLLMICNTIKGANNIYQEMKKNQEIQCYYLSTRLCPAHRKKRLEKIKEALKEIKEGKSTKKLVCITTPLIEAGVDISFGSVVRALSGIDSIAQAAGRANRNKEKEKGDVYIVQLGEKIEALKGLPTVSEAAETALGVLKDKSIEGDILSPEVIKIYFERFHEQQKKEYDFILPDGTNLIDCLNENKVGVENYKMKHGASFMPVNRCDIRKADRAFYVIKKEGITVLVPYRDDKIDGKKIINEILSDLPLKQKYQLLRKAQQISVTIFKHQFNEICKKGGICEASKLPGVYVLFEKFYTEDEGLSTTPSNENIENYSLYTRRAL